MNKKIKVKPEMIGATTVTKSLGRITIAERHADILAREGRYDLIDGIVPAKKLVALKDKTSKELNELAKDLPEYKTGMNKDDLIELIRAAPNA